MKKIIAVLCLALFAMPALVAAQQQERTKACNSAATKKGLNGDKHKTYVKSCVAGKTKNKPHATAKTKKKSEPMAASEKKSDSVAASKKQDTRPATTAARTPATPAPAQPPAASPSSPPADPPVQTANSGDMKKRIRCDEIARQSNVSPARNKEFMDKCMAG
jgi:hypothetical protein